MSRVLLVALALFALSDVARARVRRRHLHAPSRAARHATNRGAPFMGRRRLTDASPEVSEQLAKLDVRAERPSFADNVKYAAGREESSDDGAQATEEGRHSTGRRALREERRRAASNDASLVEQLADVTPPMDRPSFRDNVGHAAGKAPSSDAALKERPKKVRRALRKRRLSSTKSVAEQLKRVTLPVDHDSLANKVTNTGLVGGNPKKGGA